MNALYTTVKTLRGTLLSVPVREASQYKPQTVNSFLTAGRIIRVGEFCPIHIR